MSPCATWRNRYEERSQPKQRTYSGIGAAHGMLVGAVCQRPGVISRPIGTACGTPVGVQGCVDELPLCCALCCCAQCWLSGRLSGGVQVQTVHVMGRKRLRAPWPEQPRRMGCPATRVFTGTQKRAEWHWVAPTIQLHFFQGEVRVAAPTSHHPAPHR